MQTNGCSHTFTAQPPCPQDGDGCSSSCTVEPGFTCTATSPSICTPSGSAQPQGGPDAPPRPDPHVGPGGGGGDLPPEPAGRQRSGGTHHGWVVVLVLAAVGAVLGAAWAGRQQLADNFPRLEAAVASVAARLPGRRRRYDFAGESGAVGGCMGWEVGGGSRGVADSRAPLLSGRPAAALTLITHCTPSGDLPYDNDGDEFTALRPAPSRGPLGEYVGLPAAAPPAPPREV